MFNPKDYIWVVEKVYGLPSRKVVYKGTKEQCLKIIGAFNWKKFKVVEEELSISFIDENGFTHFEVREILKSALKNYN